MPICPSCQAEYREGFERCDSCGVALVDHLPETDDRFERLERAVAEEKAALSDPRSFDDAQRDAVLLQEAKIPCLIWGNPKMLGPSGAPLYYHLALLPEDVELARQTLSARRARMLEEEGLSRQEAVVDLTAETITCPACGFTFPRAEECPDCGLFVGALPAEHALAEEKDAEKAPPPPAESGGKS